MEEPSYVSTYNVTVPRIHVEMCSDAGCKRDDVGLHVDGNFSDNHSVIEIAKNFSANNGPQRRIKPVGDNSFNRDTNKPLNPSEGAGERNAPRRKYGLGIRNSCNSQPIGIFQKLSPGLFLDTPLSPGCADQLPMSPGFADKLPQSYLPVPSLHQPRAVDRNSSTLKSNRLTVPSLTPGKDRKLSTNCDLEELKKTTARLKLTTRRPSFVAWHERYINRPVRLRDTYTIPENEAPESNHISQEQKTRIDGKLERIKSDLIEMRLLDKNLAKDLLSLRKEINSFKLERSCQEHEDLLEDAQDELEALQQLSEMCDFPLDELNFGQTLGPLKNIGVTRLNLSARRFSTC